MRHLEGKTAIVTGAGSGLGLQKEWLEARHQRIIDAFDSCERWIAEGAGEAERRPGRTMRA